MNPFNKKYELLNIAIKSTSGTVVRRVQALQDIINSEGVTIARAGELGGTPEPPQPGTGNHLPRLR